jgi:hypothetical protein
LRNADFGLRNAQNKVENLCAIHALDNKVVVDMRSAGTRRWRGERFPNLSYP